MGLTSSAPADSRTTQVLTVDQQWMILNALKEAGEEFNRLSEGDHPFVDVFNGRRKQVDELYAFLVGADTITVTL